MNIFQIHNPCKTGKELYNGKCVKICIQGKERNQISGRCVKQKTKLRLTPKKIKSISSNTIKVHKPCSSGKEMYNGKCVKPCVQGKERNPHTGRCIKQKTQKQNQKFSQLRHSIKKTPYVNKNKNLANDIYQTFNLDQESINYLNKLVINGSAKKMRDIARNNNLYIPLQNYTNDNDMKKYIVYEILELSKNYASDRFKTNSIKLYHIKHVIDDDIELSMILKH